MDGFSGPNKTKLFSVRPAASLKKFDKKKLFFRALRALKKFDIKNLVRLACGISALQSSGQKKLFFPCAAL